MRYHEPTAEEVEATVAEQLRCLPDWWWDDAEAQGNVVSRTQDRGRRGEAHPNAVLTAEVVREIRKRVAAGERQAAVARSLGLSKDAVNRVVLRVSWGHVA